MKLFVPILLCALVLGACSKQEVSAPSVEKTQATVTETSEKPMQGKPAISGDYDEKSSGTWNLTGEWQVLHKGVEKLVFKFYGEEASVRYVTRENNEIVGKIALFGRNGFVIKPEGGKSRVFRYAIEKDQVFIGIGGSAHPVKDTSKFSFPVSDTHTVHFDGSTCTLKNGEKVLQTIECSYDREAKPPVFSYDSPVPTMVGPKRSRLLYLVGKTFVSDTLYHYKANEVK